MSYGTLRASYWFIAINGAPYVITGGGPPKVLGITVTAGFDQQVIEATIKVATDDGHPNFGDWIEIFMGATQATATCRFAGYFMEFNYTLYPREVSLVCKSPLVRAQNYDNPVINGTDLSAGGAGQTDSAMVEQILGICGLTGGYHYAVSIGGLGRLLGTVATQYYLWSEGSDGLSAIQLIDEICKGYRTFDKIGSTGGVQTVREQVSIIPSGTSPWAAFNQGYDILEATNQISVIAGRNRFLVTGYNSSTYHHNTNGYSLPLFDAPPLPSPLPFQANWWYSSSLIEFDTEADRLTAGAGVSCQEIAYWAAGQYNNPIIKTPYTTQRDDPINPGDLIVIIATAAAIGTSYPATLWVQSVSNEIDEAGAYSQKIVGIQGAS